ncbi:PH domain-containing protein [Pseudoalteromonas sp. A3]|uniref:PH domain-containing protein n=1 Tax=Pseudoalteromonas sp. A3 TaxID=142792 RepID=UPI00221EF5F3|nr:PH domain-containing protein [Pseudoalteromonas sp. A3]MCW1720410.1 PH domain-containing protein [Pseudoalteromonas sp. A3]
MFDNQQVMDLPKHSEIELNPLADKALLHVQLNWLAFYIPFCAVLFAVCYFNEAFANKAQTYLLIGVPILILLSMLYNALSIKLQGFALRNHDIAFKKGVIWQQITILPLARVQHMEIHQGPIERKLKLASLKLFSAGGVSADLQISGLTHEQCKNIRQFVQNYRQDGTPAQVELANE